VKLDILPGCEMQLTVGVAFRQAGQHFELMGREFPEGYLRAKHLNLCLPLPVNASRQAVMAEAFFLFGSIAEAFDTLVKFENVGPVLRGDLGQWYIVNHNLGDFNNKKSPSGKMNSRKGLIAVFMST
jgi:hypothetical protein